MGLSPIPGGPAGCSGAGARSLRAHGVIADDSTHIVSCGLYQKHSVTGTWKPETKNPTPDKNCVPGQNFQQGSQWALHSSPLPPE